MTVRGYIAALPALLKAHTEQEAYRIYVTDALRIVGENTAKFAGGGYIQTRYIDRVRPKPQDKRTGAEIAADVIAKAGLKVVIQTERI